MNLLEQVKKGVILSDGAMGTQLQLRGLKGGESADLWNLTHPEMVLEIHKSYLRAGANCLTTNTFGASGLGLEKFAGRSDIEKINQAAVALAMQARDDLGQECYILGDMGPYADDSKKLHDIYDNFLEQAIILVQAGVDAIILETQIALAELKLAIDAAYAAQAPVIILSLAFDLQGEKGFTPEDLLSDVDLKKVDVLGINCGRRFDVKAALEVVKLFKEHSDRPIMLQPNAGEAKLMGEKFVYQQSPADFVNDFSPLIDLGVSIIGGCCGTTPQHIKAMREFIDSRT